MKEREIDVEKLTASACLDYLCEKASVTGLGMQVALTIAEREMVRNGILERDTRRRAEFFIQEGKKWADLGTLPTAVEHICSAYKFPDEREAACVIKAIVDAADRVIAHYAKRNRRLSPQSRSGANFEAEARVVRFEGNR